MATIAYLDVDDEITSAAARIRAPGDRRLAIVLPAGSRVSTSRINFRLLAREAAARGRELAIVAPEAGTRALAATAGLPVFGSLGEYEAALQDAGPDQPFDGAEWSGPEDGGAAGGGGSALGAARGAAEEPPDGGRAEEPLTDGQLRGWWTEDHPAPAPRSAGAETAGARPRVTGAPPRSTGPHEPGPAGVRARSAIMDTVAMPVPDMRDEPRRRRFSGLVLAAVTVLLVSLLASGAGAWFLLPTASVTVKARVEPVGPLQFTVRADPLEVSVNEAAGVVPAEVIAFDLAVASEFPASGKKVTETKAAGSVRWTNCDPTRSYRIPSGTIAKTAGGLKFATSDAVFLPVAILSGNPPQITCQSRDVGVAAAEPGPDGNVAARTITVVPSDYNSVVIRVTNPAGMDGGTRTETKVVAQKDVDTAMTALATLLRDEFTRQLADPAHVPAGLTLFAATRSMSGGEPTTEPDSLVGDASPTFKLGLTATGTATAVDPGVVRQLGEDRVRAAVLSDRSLVAGTVDVQLGTPRVDGSAVLFPVTARAGQVQALDAVALRRMVRGLPVDEARERLRDYGDATVDVWPGWVTTITTFDFRLEVHVVSDVSAGEGGAGSSSPATTPAPPSQAPSGAGASARPSAGSSASPAPGGT